MGISREADGKSQVVEDGYEFFAKRQLVTLFSAPNYCGEFDNAGAMMSVDETLLCSFQVRPAVIFFLILTNRVTDVFGFLRFLSNLGLVLRGDLFLRLQSSLPPIHSPPNHTIAAFPTPPWFWTSAIVSRTRIATVLRVCMTDSQAG